MQTHEEFKEALGSCLAACEVPERLHQRLYEKLKGSVFDSGVSFSLARWLYGSEEFGSDGENSDGGASEEAALPTSSHAYPGYYLTANRDLRAEEDIWLVDHCCTFQLPFLRGELRRNELLRKRLVSIIRLAPDEASSTALASDPVEHQVNRIWANLWPYTESYELVNPRPEAVGERYWFVADEIGSALHCSFDDDKVNARLVTLPFYFSSQQCVLSLLWLTAPVEAGAVVTRRPRHRFERHCGDVVSRVLYESWSGEPPSPQVTQSCLDVWQNHCRQQADVAARCAVRNEIEVAVIDVRQMQGLLEPERIYPPLQHVAPTGGGGGVAVEAQPLPVYVSHRGVANALALTESFCAKGGSPAFFRLVSLPGDAAVLWMPSHVFRTASALGHSRYVVHLPEHEQLTVPRNLAALLQTAIGSNPLVVDHLDGVSQLRELVGSAIDERVGVNGVWELRKEDGSRAWGPIALTSWPQVRELLRVAESQPLCLVRALDAKALSLAPGTRMILHFLLIVRSLRSPETALEAFIHQFCWASFEPSIDAAVISTLSPSQGAIAGDVVATQLQSLTARESVWKAEVLPAVCRITRDIVAAVVPIQGVDHSKRGAVLDAQFLLLMPNGVADPVRPVLLGFSEQLDCSTVLELAPLVFADVLNTLCFSCRANVMKL